MGVAGGEGRQLYTGNCECSDDWDCDAAGCCVGLSLSRWRGRTRQFIVSELGRLNLEREGASWPGLVGPTLLGLLGPTCGGRGFLSFCFLLLLLFHLFLREGTEEDGF